MHRLLPSLMEFAQTTALPRDGHATLAISFFVLPPVPSFFAMPPDLRTGSDKSRSTGLRYP